MHRIRLAHVDGHIRDLYGPERTLDLLLAIPNLAHTDEGRGEIDDPRTELGPHRLDHDLALTRTAPPRELEAGAHPATPRLLGQLQIGHVLLLAVVRGERDAALDHLGVHLHLRVGEPLVVRHHRHAAAQLHPGRHVRRRGLGQQRLLEDGLESHARCIGAAAHLHVHQLHVFHGRLSHRHLRVHVAHRGVRNRDRVPLAYVERRHERG